MMDHGTAPWSRLRDYLLCVGSCRTRPDFFRAACVEIQGIIPFDSSNVFSTADLGYLGGTGSRAMQAAYDSYYRYRHVFSAIHTRDWGEMSPVVDWRHFGRFEFAVDFMWANGMWSSLQQARPGQRIVLTVHRSRRAPLFSPAETDAMELANQYLNCLLSGLERNAGCADPAPSWEMILDRFHSLSRREAEVCSLLARRLTTAEVAAFLFISPRTVEKHVERIFDKLDVRSRGRLRSCLGECLPAAGRGEYVVPSYWEAAPPG